MTHTSSTRYLIFYCPLNLFYKCVAFLPVKLVLVALKEVVRARKIAAGVHHAHHAYHHGFFIMVIVGYVKGQCASVSLAIFMTPREKFCMFHSHLCKKVCFTVKTLIQCPNP